MTTRTVNTLVFGAFLFVTLPAVFSQDSATFEFRGNVVKKAAVTLPSLTASNNTIIIRVDEIRQKPISVTLNKGDLITLYVYDPTHYEEGREVTIRAVGWQYGTGVALREVSHQDASESTAVHDKEKALESRVAQVDAAVTGRVTRIKDALQPGIYGVSEHTPRWKDALIQVSTSGALKGDVGKVIAVRFPSSDSGVRDVKWRAMPQFHEGDEGTFLLKRDTISGIPKPVLGGGQLPTFVVQTPQDVRPTTDAANIRAIVQKQSQAPEK